MIDASARATLRKIVADAAQSLDREIVACTDDDMFQDIVVRVTELTMLLTPRIHGV